jgi:hypothetical protein
MAYDFFYIAALAVLALLVLLCAALYGPIARIRKSLKGACRYLDSEWKIQGNPTFFLQDGFKLFSNKKMNGLWERYLASIGNCKGDYRYANVCEYFSPDKAMDETVNTGLASFAPIVLAIAGFLLTAATYLYYLFFSTLTSLMQVEAAALLGGILLIALGMAVYFKSLLFSTRTQFHAFVRWITATHKTLPGITEQIADVRYSMHTYNREQLKFYASLDDHIADNTIKAIQPFLEATSKVMEDFISAATDRQIEAMQHLAEHFAGTTTQLYLDQIQKISDTTASMAEIQSKTAETLQSVTTIYTESKDCIRQVGDTSSQVLERFDDYLVPVRAMNDALTESVRQLEDLVEYIRNNSRNQSFTIENLTKYQDDLLGVSNKSIYSMQTFFNDFKDQYSSSIISLRAASNDMLAAGELLKGSYTGLAEGVNRDVEQVFHTFEEDLATISVHLGRSIHDLQEAIDELPEILRRINSGKI